MEYLIIVTMITFGDKPNFGPKPFNFFRFWADNGNFLTGLEKLGMVCIMVLQCSFFVIS